MKSITSSSRIGRVLTPYLYVFPAVAFFVAFIVYPFAFANWLSLHKWNGFTPLSGAEWLGLDNYRDLLRDPWVGTTVKNTLLYSVTVSLVIQVIAFALAFALFYVIRGRLAGILRTLFFYPAVLSSITIALAWKDLLRREGLVNHFIGLFTRAPFTKSWIGDPATALWAIMWMAIWWGAGWNMVIYLAGLTGISRELLEAAQLDGAGTYQIIRHIIVGILRPVISLSLLLSIIGNFQTFGLIYATTKGGPLHATELIGTYTYWLAFSNNGPQRMGYAAVFSTLMTIALFIFALFRIRSTRLI
jgi:ABC-type sugar transport system permease subunit